MMKGKWEVRRDKALIRPRSAAFTLYAAELEKSTLLYFWGRLSRWPGMSLPKWHVRRRMISDLTLEPLDWDFHSCSARNDASHRVTDQP